VAETVAGRATPTARTEGAVLLVDADPNVAELLTTTLVVQGFQVYTAADGPAAVERARAVRPDAVILEVTVPGVEDFGLLGRLRARGVDAPGLLPHHTCGPPGQAHWSDRRRRRLRFQAIQRRRGRGAATCHPAPRPPR
jgi:hypothetical protein